MAKEINNSIRCAFCGKTQDQVRRMVAGPGVYICNECIDLCHEIVTDDLTPEQPGAAASTALKRPKEIKEILDQYVVGQDEAKRTERTMATLNFKSPISLCLVRLAVARPILPRPWPKS